MKPSHGTVHHSSSWLQVLGFLLLMTSLRGREMAAEAATRSDLVTANGETCPVFNLLLLTPATIQQTTATCGDTYNLSSPYSLADKIHCCRGIASLFTLVLADNFHTNQFLEPAAPQCFDTVVATVSSENPKLQDNMNNDCNNYLPAAPWLLTAVSSPSACQVYNQSVRSFQSLFLNSSGHSAAAQLEELERECHDLQKSGNCSSCLSRITDAAAGLSHELRQSSIQACSLSVLLYVVAAILPAGVHTPGTLSCFLQIPEQVDSQRSEDIKSGAKAASEGRKLGLDDSCAARRNKARRNWEITLPLVSILSAMCGVLFGLLSCCWHNNRDKRTSQRKFASRTSGLFIDWNSSYAGTLNTFEFADIKAATNNFAEDHIVGEGGFGCVYRGTLPDGRLIAVKRFNDSRPDGDSEFANEAHVISSVRHRNLVVLLGYCVAKEVGEGHQRLLIYDYMENGSLADFLSDSSRDPLTWEQRKRITLGVARGICYLHRGVKPTIIHRDVKPSNILLDGQLCPRLADFGLAKVNKEGATHFTTRVAGTFGYVAPEYAMYGQLTESSDVYSFGVVVLELITALSVLVSKSAAAARAGRRTCCLSPPCLLPDWAWAVLKDGTVTDLVDPRIRGQLGPEEMLEVELFVHVALLCAHPHPGNRAASMHQALKMLEGDTALPRTLPDRPLPLNSTGFDPELLKHLVAGNSETGDRQDLV